MGEWCPCDYGQSAFIVGKGVAGNKTTKKEVDICFEACSMKPRFSSLNVNCVQIKVFIFLIDSFQLVGLLSCNTFATVTAIGIVLRDATITMLLILL